MSLNWLQQLIVDRHRRRLPQSHEGSKARWKRVTEIVDGALRRPDPRERARYLRSACAGDPALQSEVEELLRFEGADSGILAARRLGRQQTPATDPDPEPPPQLRQGRRVGPYVVDGQLGAGGMGVVFLARDTELDRQVALKVLRRDQASEELLSRFDSERRILARLDHPYIARIFDAGMDDGLPYFAMEYVEGEPIDVYCDGRHLPIDERIRLVLKVCDALGDAHRNLVVHRDLKPSNLLVTTDGEPKLLDFGIAKDLDPLRQAAVTRTGRQPLTLPNASPEQVRGRPVTVATDVYSLGVLLYGLLCGHPPYELDDDPFDNLHKICEQPPQPPSQQTMLALEVWRGEAPSTIAPDVLARARHSEPGGLRRQLRGDLDAIVLKALAKDPMGRYRSIERLAEDLQRHLDGLPVAARHPSFAYRTGKFLRRRRWRLVAAGVVLASLIVGSAAWFNSRHRVRVVEEAQRRAAEQAAEAERQAEALTNFARNLVRATDPDASGGQPLTAHEILERGWEQARRTLGDQPELLAHQLEALGLAYWSLGDLDATRPLLEQSLRLRRRIYVGDHRLVARGLNNLAALHHGAGDRTRAERLYRLALAMKRRLGQTSEDLTKVESNLATLLAFRGEYQEAEALYRQVLEIRRGVYVPGDLDIADTLRSLGNLLFLKGDFGTAEESLREALELRCAATGRTGTTMALILGSLGRVLHAQGRLGEAEEMLSEALAIRSDLLGPDHLHVALTEKDLASVYFDLGKNMVAELLWQRSLRILRENKPEDSWELADGDSQLGARLAAQGRFEEAEVCLKNSYETLRKSRGEQALYTRRAYDRLRGLDRLSSAHKTD